MLLSLLLLQLLRQAGCHVASWRATDHSRTQADALPVEDRILALCQALIICIELHLQVLVVTLCDLLQDVGAVDPRPMPRLALQRSI